MHHYHYYHHDILTVSLHTHAVQIDVEYSIGHLLPLLVEYGDKKQHRKKHGTLNYSQHIRQEEFKA